MSEENVKNLYDLNDPAIESEGSGVQIFPLGISEENFVESITTAVSENGNQFLKIIFKSIEGSAVNMFEFEVTAKEDEDPAATLKRMDSQKKRLVHVLNKLMPEGAQLPAATNWAELCQRIVAALPAASFAGKTFRLKTIYSYNNYVSLPKYVPFIESMSVDKVDSRLKIDPKFDKMVKDEPSPDADITDAASAPGTEENADLPF